MDGWQSEAADLLLLHDGVIPSTQMSRALGCAHIGMRAALLAAGCRRFGRSSVPGILVAGDGAGVAGAAAAVLSGRIAALALAGGDTRALRAERARHLRARRTLDALFPPRPVHLDDATLVCRCEEVTAGAIRQAACRLPGYEPTQGLYSLRHGTLPGPDLRTRRDRGAGQGAGTAVSSIEPLRTRFPIKPVTVGELAELSAVP